MYIIFLSMMLLSSCSKKNLTPLFSKGVLTKKMSHESYCDLFEQAKNIDVSVPLGFSIIKKETHEHVEHFIIEGSNTLDHIKNFYVKEMERLGWEIIDLSTAEENLLICKNSKKYCVISARQNKQKNCAAPKIILHLFIKKKQAYIESESEGSYNAYTNA